MAMDDSSEECEPTQVDVGSVGVSDGRQRVSPIPVGNRFEALSSVESDSESPEGIDRRRHRRLRWIWEPASRGTAHGGTSTSSGSHT